jgi:hypothetical protein
MFQMLLGPGDKAGSVSLVAQLLESTVSVMEGEEKWTTGAKARGSHMA